MHRAIWMLPSELLLLAQICTKSGGEGIGPIPKGRAGDLLLKERRGPTPNAPPLDLLAPLLTKSWLRAWRHIRWDCVKALTVFSERQVIKQNGHTSLRRFTSCTQKRRWRRRVRRRRCSFSSSSSLSKISKKAAAATTTSITASAILWTYTCISFACNLTRVGARCRAATARQGFNGNARQRAVCERGLDDSLPGRFATWMVRHLDVLRPGRFARLNVSIPGRFATSLDVSPPEDKD